MRSRSPFSERLRKLSRGVLELSAYRDSTRAMVTPDSSSPRPTVSDSVRAEPRDERAALDHLFSVTYEELRRLASAVRRSDPSASITPTALVNEAWLKLARTPQLAHTSPLHFRRIAARAMRQVLIEAARRRSATKRDASAWYVTFDAEAVGAASNHSLDVEALLALDAALTRLSALSPRQAQVVEARYFGGLSMPDTALAVGVSESTVLREWRLARAWLARELGEPR